MFSERVSLQRTGRPVRFASHATSANSGSAPIFAPNPPPTSGVMTCTSAASTPSQPATSSRVDCAFCVEHHSVSRPSSPHAAAAARVSSGAAASRWLLIFRVTTTSQPSNRASSNGFLSKATAMFVPASGKSSTSPARLSSMSTTAGSGS
jgi:hypothetical protein